MMWSELKAVVTWFRGEQEPPDTDADPGVASLMRLVAANAIANIRKVQEQSDNLPFSSDEQTEIAAASTSEPLPIAPTTGNESTEESPSGASGQGDDQAPPREA